MISILFQWVVHIIILMLFNVNVKKEACHLISIIDRGGDAMLSDQTFVTEWR